MTWAKEVRARLIKKIRDEELGPNKELDRRIIRAGRVLWSLDDALRRAAPYVASAARNETDKAIKASIRDTVSGIVTVLRAADRLADEIESARTGRPARAKAKSRKQPKPKKQAKGK